MLFPQEFNVVPSGVQITIKGDQKLSWKHQRALKIMKKFLGGRRNKLFLKTLKR
jgi:hypothetical protein